MGMEGYGFSCKLRKKRHESSVFLSKWMFGCFEIGMGAWSFLENGRFVDKIWA